MKEYNESEYTIMLMEGTLKKHGVPPSDFLVTELICENIKFSLSCVKSFVFALFFIISLIKNDCFLHEASDLKFVHYNKIFYF